MNMVDIFADIIFKYTPVCILIFDSNVSTIPQCSTENKSTLFQFSDGYIKTR